MPLRAHLKKSDLRGAVHLAADATTGLTDLVEAMHERIARLPGRAPKGEPGRTNGITGFVYRSVRGVTRLAAGGIDALLRGLPSSLDAGLSSSEREAVVAALNGVLGDHLLATGNPLATPMELRLAGQSLSALPSDSKTLLLMLHGLCMNDLQWRRNGHHHGQNLANELRMSFASLRYNSGQHISTNGRLLALKMQTWFDAAARPPARIVLLCHSMGGLVARSALHQARQLNLGWPEHVSDIFFLGTPHHGAPLERAGNWLHLLLGATPYAAPLGRLAGVRSAGITDLRHGNLLDQDWAVNEPYSGKPDPADHRTPVPLPEAIRCYAVAASIGGQAGDLKDRLLGDGLVPLDSALGQHADPARALNFAPDRSWTGYRLNHMDLLSDPAVYARLRNWLA